MLQTLALTTFVLAVVGTHVAVIRDVPILNAFIRPRTNAGHYGTHIVCAIFDTSAMLDYFGVKLSGASPLAYTWPLALVYLAWCVVTNLRGSE